MAYTIEHQLINEQLVLEKHDDLKNHASLVNPGSLDRFFFTVTAQGSIQMLHPGVLQPIVTASVTYSVPAVRQSNTEPPPPPVGVGDSGSVGVHQLPTNPVTDPLHNGVNITVEDLPHEFRLLDPDGRLFTRTEVTLEELKQFRTLQGVPRPWSYTLSGTSRIYQPDPSLNQTVTDPRGSIYVTVLETVPSQSAPPLVPRVTVDLPGVRPTFDLNRVGNFVATVEPVGFLPEPTWRGSMRLLDPDGVAVAQTTAHELHWFVSLAALGKSRDASGNPRLWSLEVTPQLSGGQVNAHTVTATVLGEGRITAAVLQERINRLLGPTGTALQFSGQNAEGMAQGVLTISDVAVAETLDMQGVLDSALRAHGESTDVLVNAPMVIGQTSADLDYGLAVDVSTLRTTSIALTVGAAQHLPAATPALHLTVDVAGELKVRWEGLDLATVTVTDGQIEFEVGLHVDPDGTPRMVSWVTPEPFDVEFSDVVVGFCVAAAVATLGIAGVFVGAVTPAVIEEFVDEYVSQQVQTGLTKLFEDPELAPRILMTLLGANLTYLPVRFEGNDILFEHVAPAEPELRPRRDYHGAIGRSVNEPAGGSLEFTPPALGDTWAADNLTSKIEHIVVVMMENRSYDHVLGYRSLAPTGPGDHADGWSGELLDAVNAQAEGFRPPPPEGGTPVIGAGVTPPPKASQPVPPAGQHPIHLDTNPPVGPMRTSAFKLNSLNLRTRLPKPVGHQLADVTEQLAEQFAGPDARQLNDPAGFINNFRKFALANDPFGDVTGDDPSNVVPFDVLRYYEKKPDVTYENTHIPVDDLPMYGFLAENYGYCDRYYSSHPGPTLPNRMYSLSGDLQHDRYGFPITDNNHGDDFLLSRATTIYDLLTRHDVPWKVYESAPSVTMLRMFARYAGDDLHIRPLEELERDVALDRLASFVVVDPAMHSAPEDDDHPVADMYRGQGFIRGVYTALTQNADVWNKTLLLITYDEHGGFYDHVVPPIADVYKPLVVNRGLHLGSVAGPGPAPNVLSPRPADHLGLHLSPEAKAILHGEHPSSLAPPADATVKVPYGVRVPTFVVSPWVPPGKGPDVTLDHCSILKTVLARFCPDTKPFLSDRVNASHSFDSYLSETEPRDVAVALPNMTDLPLDVPELVSTTTKITTPPLFRKRMRDEQVDYHDLSGRVARMLGR